MLNHAAAFDRIGTTDPPVSTPCHFRTVHVLGGGIAGLIAARVLADAARRVVIIEPDGLAHDLDGAPRPGVPQGYQVHTLLPGGRAQFERFFPGIAQEALDNGAILSTSDRTVAYVDNAEQLGTPNAELLSCSRPFLESLIRRRVLALPNVSVKKGRVTGLTYARGAVNAVRYVSSGEVVESTEFVVDATGRASRLPYWLQHGGWPRPETERLRVEVQYLSARFRRSRDWPGPYTGVCRYSLQSSGKGLPGAAFAAIEDEQWAIMLAYYEIDGRRESAHDFSSSFRDLPAIFQEVAQSELIGGVVPYRHPDSRWRHFEAMSHFPAGLVAVGDSAASFNPVYGQGMSSAALHASCLSEYLRSEPDTDAPARYFLDLQKVVIEAAWQLSTAGDAARLGVRNPSVTATERRRAWALRQVMTAMSSDVEVATAVRAVTFMTAHPESLTEPDLVRRAARINHIPEEEFHREFEIAQ
jgi:2-polyprenyl-6-methoxyphenol hydroxylase-like FAD-dependent oxidoreductase